MYIDQEKLDAFENNPENLFNIINTMKDGVYIVNKNYEVEYVNAAFIEEFGPIMNRKCYEYRFHRFEPCPWCFLPEIQKGKTLRVQRQYDDASKTYDIIDTPIKKENGSISKLEVIRDITSIKNTEQKLKESEDNYRVAYE